MKPRHLEGQHQEIGRLIKKTLMILAPAIPSLLAMMSCGYVNVKVGSKTKKLEVHDHNGVHIVHEGSSRVLYNPEKHGDIVEFVDEGQQVPYMPDNDGKVAIHRNSSDDKYGPYEFKYEYPTE